MILHKLILQHLQHRDDSDFYQLQAREAASWLERNGVPLSARATVLDLGCGHGLFGRELMARGASVTFADFSSSLLPELASVPFRVINLDQDDVRPLGRYDLVICSNVLEHLARPERFLAQAHHLLNPSGCLYLSWTNWLSPWGGHEFSPWHYFGPRLGPALYDRIHSRARIHTPGVNLFPTYIGAVLRSIRRQSTLRIIRVAPRYYTELAWLARVPLLREFLTWNCALLLQAKS